MDGVTTNGTTRTTAGRGSRPARAERGAILVQTAIMLVGLTAFGAFIVDYGVLWTARRQVQNAADAAALAAAISLGFDAPGDQARARQNAIIAVGQNPVWGAPADMGAGDVTFPPCPVGAVPAQGGGVCVRVEVFRNQRAGATPLPTIFANLVNVSDQGVKATATAQVLYGSSTDCVRPLAVPDKWQELRGDVPPAGWDVLDSFDRYHLGALLTPADFYQPPGAGGNGTGYSRGPTGGSAGDYGANVEFAPAVIPGKASASFFLPVHIAPGGTFAGDLASCSSRIVEPGDTLQVELNNVAGEFAQGVLSLIGQDPAASWSVAMNGGRGGVAGGCMASGACTISPRIIAVPVFDPDAWDLGGPGNGVVRVTRIAGFFVANLEDGYVVGRLMVYPSPPRSTMNADPNSAFVVSAALVR